jgi:hypothetical protein
MGPSAPSAADSTALSDSGRLRPTPAAAGIARPPCLGGPAVVRTDRQRGRVAGTESESADVAGPEPPVTPTSPRSLLPCHFVLGVGRRLSSRHRPSSRSVRPRTTSTPTSNPVRGNPLIGAVAGSAAGVAEDGKMLVAITVPGTAAVAAGAV